MTNINLKGSLKIAITGSSGLIGENLKKFLKDEKHSIFPIVRCKPHDELNEIYWNPDNGEIDSKSLEGMDVIINLAGKRIPKKKLRNMFNEEFWDSRINSTTLLSKTLANLSHPPKVFLSASSIDWYSKDCNTEVVTENNGFLGNELRAQMCNKWEESAKIAENSGIRVVNMRIPYVLSATKSSIMAIFIPIVNAGLGGTIGNGKQLMCFITLYDIVHAVSHIIHEGTLRGPINMVTPTPTTNEEFMHALSELLNKPLYLKYPQWLLRILYGGLTENLIKGSLNLAPEKLINSGFNFKYVNIETAMRYTLGVSLKE